MTAIGKQGLEIKVGDTVTLTGKVTHISAYEVITILIDDHLTITAKSKSCEKLGKLQQEARESLERAQKGAEQGASGLLKSEY